MDPLKNTDEKINKYCTLIFYIFLTILACIGAFYAIFAAYDWKIEKNDFNLNIPRYVDTFEAEEEIDLVKISEKLAALSLEAKQTDKVITGYCAELGIVSPFEGSK